MSDEVLQVIENVSSTLEIAAIRQDGGTQMREALSENVIVQYADFVSDGVEFPPVTVFYDGQDYWLADGFHRLKAHALAKKEKIHADIRPGSRLDAVRYAIGANATNGKPRTSGDLMRAYRCAVDNGLCRGDDADAVQSLLHCSSRWARELTRQAREEAKLARDREIQRLAGEGKTQREIAARVGVDHKTVGNLLNGEKRKASEIPQPPAPIPPPIPSPLAGMVAEACFITEEDDNETDPPEHQEGDAAYCKYCGNSHSDWGYTADVISDSGHGWVCGICDHCVSDEDMEAAREEDEEDDMPVHNHRAQGTGENEWYTPAEHIEAARAVLGGFDLDPATSTLANQTVGAERIFTVDDNGLEQPWSGRVWLNPPYSQPAIAQFAEKMTDEWKSGNIDSAIALTHNYTDTAWFHRLASSCNAICFTRGRIGFLSPDGKKAAPTQGQAFFYFGNKVDAFVERFASIGFVVEVRG